MKLLVLVRVYRGKADSWSSRNSEASKSRRAAEHHELLRVTCKSSQIDFKGLENIKSSGEIYAKL